MLSRLYLIVLAVLILFSCSNKLEKHKGSLTYYVDSELGKDDNNGTSIDAAWKTLDNLNNTVFSPGDSILLKCGSVFSGYLELHGSGKKDSIIVISSYGKGNKPIINAEGKSKEAILLQNINYWCICNIEITNKGSIRKAFRYGIRLSCRDFGTMHHIRLNNIYVHDVNGSIISHRGEGAGIFYENIGKLENSNFDSLIIENCTIENTDRNGIHGYSALSSRRAWFPNEHLIIRNNTINNVGGDGIKPFGCNGAIIENNVVTNGKMRCKDFAAGINLYACDNSNVIRNEVSAMQGSINGRAFCAGSNCKNNIFQYNYSHNNIGGFVYVNCEPISFDNIGCQNTIIRYNISQNDLSEIFHFDGPSQYTQIYNNTIYISDSLENHLFISAAHNGWASNLEVFNNIFHTKYKSSIVHKKDIKGDDGKFIKSTGLGGVTFDFNHNLFSGRIDNMAEHNNSVSENALLDSIGTAKDGFSSLAGYKLSKESPAINAGLNINDTTLFDFWDVKVPQDSLTDIGASEFNM